MYFCSKEAEIWSASSWKTYNVYAGKLPYLRGSGAPEGQPLGVPKPPLGHKIHIFGNRKLKLGKLVVKTYKLYAGEIPYLRGSGAPKGHPLGVPKPPLGHKINISRDSQL